MYTSTYRAIVTFVLLALVAIWGTMIIVSMLPKEAPKPPTYTSLYSDCIAANRYEVDSEDCKELVIKEIEKNERTTTEDGK